MTCSLACTRFAPGSVLQAKRLFAEDPAKRLQVDPCSLGLASYARYAGNLCRLGSLRTDRLHGLHFGRVEWLIDLLLVLLVLVSGGGHLQHLATTFEHRTLLDDQRRRLDVAVHFCCAA